MLLGPELLSSIQTDLDAMMMEPDKDKWRWKTGADFMKYLSDRFDNVDLKLDASRRLADLYQKNMPFSEFEVELTKLMDRCNLDPAMKVHYLRNKINKRLRDAL
ncbi:hypothetical protein N0V85_009979, partial [Neurospora sp. IMI 360204]